MTPRRSALKPGTDPHVLLPRRALAPNEIAGWFRDTFESRFAFLLAVNVLLLFVGMFVETSAAILVLAPILVPIAIPYGVDPVQFGPIIVVNLALGMITPPVGVNLFATAAAANLPVENIIPQLPWFVLTVFAALMIATYVPAVSLWPMQTIMGIER